MNRPTRNALYSLSGEAASRLFGFLTTAVLAHRVGLDAFGQIGFAAALLAYGVVVTDLGLLTTCTRAVARDRTSARDLVRDVTGLRLALAIGAAVMLGIVALILPKPAPVKWLVVAYGFCVIAQSLLIEWVCVGAEMMWAVSFSRIVANGGYFLLVLFLVRGPADVLLVPGSFAVSTLLGVILLYLVFARSWGLTVPRFAPSRWLGLLREAWPVGLASVLSQLHVNFGLVILGLLGTDAQTGTYAAAYRLVFFLMTIDRVFYAVFFPVVTRYMAATPERLPALTGTAVRLVLAAVLPVCVTLVLMARPVVTALFGAQFAGAVPVTQVLGWFLIASIMNSLTGYTLVAAGNERRFLRNIAVGSFVSLALNVVGVAIAGAMGAAIGTLTGELCILALMARDFTATVRPRLELRVLVPVLATVGGLAAYVLLDNLSAVAAGAAGVGAYLLLVVSMRGVSLGDFGMAREP